jgi:hypothetical protein
MARTLLPIVVLALCTNICSADETASASSASKTPADDTAVMERLLEGANGEQWGTPDGVRFFGELRGAISRRDAAAMALLVGFPLRLNLCGGAGVALENEAALQERFDEAFPAWLRNAVLKLNEINTDNSVWGEGEIGIADGLLWIKRSGSSDTSRFRVRVVNACEDYQKPPAASSAPRLLYACETEKHRVIVDAAAKDAPRYRAWNKPRFLPDSPDIALRGTSDLSGTGPCTSRTWSFGQGKATIELKELKCTFGSDGPPNDARAQLTVLADGKPKKIWWCY